ncbi:MAG: helix-turn-helix transcriptional regulator [Albidovulum sp.]
METDPRVKVWAERIGHQLRSTRKAQGLSLKDLSRLSGSTLPTLSHIERATRDVKLSTLVALADALRVDLPTLFEDHHTTGSSPAKGNADGYQLDDD